MKNDLQNINSNSIISSENLPEIQSTWAVKWATFADVSEASRRTYNTGIKNFFCYLSGQGITRPTRETVINWKRETEATKKPTTAQIYLTAVRLFFAWLYQEGLYPNVAEHIKPVKVSQEFRHDYLTKNQAADVLDTINTDTEAGARDYAMQFLMMTAGLRTVEIIRADVDDLRNYGGACVLWIQGKGETEKNTFVRLSAPVEKSLRAYLKARGAKSGQPLFTSVSNHDRGGRMTTRSIRRICKGSMSAAGYESARLTAHSYRHTAATLNLENGGTIQETADLLRHHNMNTTLIYSHNLQHFQNTSCDRVTGAICGAMSARG